MGPPSEVSRFAPHTKLLDSFLAELDEEFAQKGFKRVADQVWSEAVPCGPSAARAAVTCSDSRASPPSFRVTAFAGVTILPVEQLLSRTWPEPRERWAPAVQRELGTLREPPEQLDVEVEEGFEALAALTIADRFSEDALPWIESLRDPARLLDAIGQSGVPRAVVLPAALFVLGRTHEAVAALDSELAALGQVEERSAPGWPSWASLYRRFSDALRAEILTAN